MGTAGTDTEWAWEVVMADTSILIMEAMEATEAMVATGVGEDMEAMATEASLEVIQATEVMAMEI